MNLLQLVEKRGLPLAGFLVRFAHWLQTSLDGVMFGRLYLDKVFAEVLLASLFTCADVCIGQKGLDVCVFECYGRGCDASILDGLYLFVL